MPAIHSVSLVAFGNDNSADENAYRKIANLASQRREPMIVAGLGTCVDVNSLADDPRRSAAVLDPLDAAEDFFGVWLTNGKGAHVLANAAAQWRAACGAGRTRLDDNFQRTRCSSTAAVG